MSLSKTTDLTVILPCAGYGSRLGTSGPKELFEVFPGEKLIDYTLAHLKAAAKTPFEIAIVVRPGKELVWEYVAGALPDRVVHCVYFNNKFREWPGSIHSAQKHFNKKNVVLLPDSFLEITRQNPYTDSHGKSLLELLSIQLDHKNIAIAWIPCTDPSRIQSLGAVNVSEKGVVEFQDKPIKGLDRFNGFWGSFGFCSEYADPFYEYLSKSINHQASSWELTQFCPAGAVPVHSYVDLGTKDSINEFIQSHADSTRLPIK